MRSETESTPVVDLCCRKASLTKLSMPFGKALARANYKVLRRARRHRRRQSGGRTACTVWRHPTATERAGMALDAGNIFTKRVDDRVLFRLENLGKLEHFTPAWDEFRTGGLTLSMSVPAAQDPAKTFDHMVETAKQLTSFLGARLLDQDQKPLSEKGIAAIRSQIQGIDARMRAFGIAPGSVAARRLFAVD
jgi:hypothetical protein